MRGPRLLAGVALVDAWPDAGITRRTRIVCTVHGMGAVRLRAEVFVLNARRSMSVRFILSSNVSETMISK